MILCDAKDRLSRQSVVEHPYGNYRINNYNDGVEDVDLNSLYKDQDPVSLWIEVDFEWSWHSRGDTTSSLIKTLPHLRIRIKL